MEVKKILVLISLITFSNCGMIDSGKAALAKIAKSGAIETTKGWLLGSLSMAGSLFDKATYAYILGKGMDLTGKVVDFSGKVAEGYYQEKNLPNIIVQRRLEYLTEVEKTKQKLFVFLTVLSLVIGYIIKKIIEYKTLKMKELENKKEE